MSCARFLLTESNLKLTMKTRRRQILPPSPPQCYRNYTAINQERKHNKVTRGGDVTEYRCLRYSSRRLPASALQQTLSTLQRWRPGGGSIERPPREQHVSDSAEAPCASPLQMQQQRSTPRTHGAALLTFGLLTRRFSAPFERQHLQRPCIVHLFLVLQ